MAKFCGNCGSPLNPQTGKCPKCQQTDISNSSSDVLDSQAENKMQERITEFSNIGEVNQTVEKAKGKKRTAIITGLGVLCLLLIGIGIYIVWNVFNIPEVNYTVLEDGTIEITEYVGSDTVVNIPKKIDGKVVASIGNGAFKNCLDIKEVSIPNSVTKIGEEAFENCSSLTSVDIPNGVIEIGYCAFENCSSLTSADIPNSVTKIDKTAFANCNNLTSITIPSEFKDTEISMFGFGGPISLEEINVDPNNEYYSSKDGVLFNKDGTELIKCPMGKKETYTIPNGVKSIDDYAFHNCGRLTEITIPDSVTEIGDYAFYNCKSLISVDMPNSVTKIGASAFEKCGSLTSVDIPNSVTKIGESVFSNCSSLTSVAIPNSVIEIGAFAFENCSSLTSVAIPNSVTKIGESAFSNCSSLTSVDISNNVTKIGASAFENCSSLISVDIPNGVIVIDKSAFENCSSLTSVDIPNSVTKIGKSVFSNCSSLTSVAIPNSVIEIGAFAFENCSSLTSVDIQNGIIMDVAIFGVDGSKIKSITIFEIDTEINMSSLSSDCFSSLEEINVDPNNEYYSSKDGVLFNKDGTELIKCPRGKKDSYSIPNGVKSIADEAFHNCNDLVEITIPDSVTEISEYAFSATGFSGNYASENLIALEEINVDSDNEYYSSKDGVLFNKDGTELIKCPGGKTGTYAIPNGVKSIAYEAFYNCSDLTEITIPDSVTEIGAFAFENCTSLTSVDIPNSVTKIGGYAFADCSSLKNVYYTGTQEEWNDIEIFSENSELNNATIHYNHSSD